MSSFIRKKSAVLGTKSSPLEPPILDQPTSLIGLSSTAYANRRSDAMNTRLSLFPVAHALFTVSHSLADADRHDTINSRLSHANKQSESLRQLIREQQRIIRNQGAALSQADDAVLGDRIESVKDDLVSVRAEVELSQDALMEKSQDIEHVVARVSDMEIAVGMPGTDVVIEPSVDLVQPSHTYQNCRVAFRTINWAEFRDWTMRQIKRGTTCRTPECPPRRRRTGAGRASLWGVRSPVP